MFCNHDKTNTFSLFCKECGAFVCKRRVVREAQFVCASQTCSTEVLIALRAKQCKICVQNPEYIETRQETVE